MVTKWNCSFPRFFLRNPSKTNYLILMQYYVGYAYVIFVANELTRNTRAVYVTHLQTNFITEISDKYDVKMTHGTPEH